MSPTARSVHFGEGHAAGVLGRKNHPICRASTNEILPAASRFCSNHAIPNPCALQYGHHVVQTVAVHVIDEHFVPAALLWPYQPNASG